MEPDDDDPFNLQFARGDDADEYLDDVSTHGIANQHSVAPADGGKRMDDILADWLPESSMLATECNMKLELNKAVPQQRLGD